MFNGTGRRKWREEASQAIKEISRQIAEDFVEITVGMDDQLYSYSEDLFVRIMVAVEGNQANGSLKSKPGQQVYGEEINGKHLSRAKSEYLLPTGFNQTGLPDGIVKNTIAQIKKNFEDALQSASLSLPDQVFYSNVLVSEVN